MSDQIQIPPVPAECDLRDFSFMPLEFRRLFTSETWLLAKPEEKVAALALWCESWHQVPASSLPDNDRVLAHLSQAGARWLKVRDQAMRGWLQCSDGRLYHPVVAEKALEAWERKLEQRKRTHAARVAKLQKQISHATGDEKSLLHAQLQVLLQEDVTGSKGQLKGQGREGTWKATGSSLCSEPSADKTSSAAVRRRANGDAEGRTVETWQAYAGAYQQRYGVPPTRNRAVNGQLAKYLERVPLEEAPDIAAFYVQSKRGLYASAKHPVNLLLRDAEALRTEWLTGRQGTDAEARQADRTAATAGLVDDLLHEHGHR